MNIFRCEYLLKKHHRIFFSCFQALSSNFQFGYLNLKHLVCSLYSLLLLCVLWLLSSMEFVSLKLLSISIVLYGVLLPSILKCTGKCGSHVHSFLQYLVRKLCWNIPFKIFVWTKACITSGVNKRLSIYVGKFFLFHIT